MPPPDDASEDDLVPIEKLLTVADLARLLQSSRSFVYKAAEVGTLPCVRIGALLRFDIKAIRAWLKGERNRGNVNVPGTRG
jgi:excisionase family DNA binding protein